MARPISDSKVMPSCFSWKKPINVPCTDLKTTVEAVLHLHLSLEFRHSIVAFTLSQIETAWQFDGGQYRESQQVIAQQVQSIQLVFSKPERLLALLPASATLQKRPFTRAEHTPASASTAGPARSAPNRSIGRARSLRITQARAYVAHLQLLYDYSRLAKAS
ncbi:MAG: hypothetical protein ACRC7D_10580 [Aeromonas popoffii]|uniref:hypothetical protein n=1 Tax=Aeromonas popoffii TaxID=70856 RepID=UPI003F35A39F